MINKCGAPLIGEPIYQPCPTKKWHGLIDLCQHFFSPKLARLNFIFPRKNVCYLTSLSKHIQKSVSRRVICILAIVINKHDYPLWYFLNLTCMTVSTPPPLYNTTRPPNPSDNQCYHLIISLHSWLPWRHIFFCLFLVICFAFLFRFIRF